MDRRIRALVGFGMAALTLAVPAGCRSVRDEVPPGRRQQRKHEPGTPAVEFSTQPPETKSYPGGPMGGAMGNLAPSNGPAGASGLAPYGSPSDHSYGPPGTSGSVPGSMTPSNLLPPSRPLTTVPDPDVALPPLGGPATKSSTPPSNGVSGSGGFGGLPPGTP